MSRLDDYRTALLAAVPDISDEELAVVLESRGSAFPLFVVDHGLGPLWHERTGHEAFHKARMQAEALFVLQEQAMSDVGVALARADVDYALFKGGANRLLLYENPANRVCFDLDILVRPCDRVAAAMALVEIGFDAAPEERSISRELVLSRNGVDIDLHWALLREGRLKHEPTELMLDRRQCVRGEWMLGDEDALFVMLVHSAFAKHLDGWELGLHRLVDLLAWLRDQQFDWSRVHAMLAENGVCAAAWATLRWLQLVAEKHMPPSLPQLLIDLEPGRARRNWIDLWLRKDLPGRTASYRWTRLLGFSMFLHDTAGDALRAARGRRQASRRLKADLDTFRVLADE